MSGNSDYIISSNHHASRVLKRGQAAVILKLLSQCCNAVRLWRSTGHSKAFCQFYKQYKEKAVQVPSPGFIDISIYQGPGTRNPGPHQLIVLQHLRPNKDRVIFIAIKIEKAITLNPLPPCVCYIYLVTDDPVGSVGSPIKGVNKFRTIHTAPTYRSKAYHSQAIFLIETTLSSYPNNHQESYFSCSNLKNP